MEYRELWNEKLKRLNESRYYFLNSAECMVILDRLTRIEEAGLTEKKIIKLLKEHKAEKLLHDKRETEMLRSIYNITTQHPFDESVFICGAEHRHGIKKKIKEFETKENNKIK